MLFIVGPLISQHIQQWYQHYNEYDAKLPVHVFTVHPGGEALPNNFKVHRAKLTGTRLDFLFLAPLLLIYYLLLRPKVVNFHFVSSYGLLSLLLPVRSCRFLLHTWGSDVNMSYDAMPGLKSRLVSMALSRMEWVNAPAEHIKNKLLALGADEKRVEVYQYGVDCDYLSQLACDRVDALPIFISNRNWQSIYRIPLLIEAFLEWQSRQSRSCQLWLYGTGSDLDKMKVDEVISRYDQKLTQRVKIMGYVPKEEMLSQIAHAHFFVSIPTRDGLPISLLEAMMLELFPIVSLIDANKEILDKGTTVFFAGNDSQTLSELFDAAIDMDKTTALARNKEQVLLQANLKLNLQRFYKTLRLA